MRQQTDIVKMEGLDDAASHFAFGFLGAMDEVSAFKTPDSVWALFMPQWNTARCWRIGRQASCGHDHDADFTKLQGLNRTDIDM